MNLNNKPFFSFGFPRNIVHPIFQDYMISSYIVLILFLLIIIDKYSTMALLGVGYVLTSYGFFSIKSMKLFVQETLQWAFALQSHLDVCGLFLLCQHENFQTGLLALCLDILVSHSSQVCSSHSPGIAYC